LGACAIAPCFAHGRGQRRDTGSCKGTRCDLKTSSLAPAERRRAALPSKRSDATAVCRRHIVEQVACGAARTGVSIKPQFCPGAKPGLFHNSTWAGLQYGPWPVAAQRSPTGAYSAFLTAGSSPWRNRGLWRLCLLGRAHWATFGPVVLSAH
jgi:hypothetical protein